MNQVLCDRCKKVMKPGKGVRDHEFAVPGFTLKGDFCPKCYPIVEKVVSRYDMLRRDRLQKFRKVLLDPKADLEKLIAWAAI